MATDEVGVDNENEQKADTGEKTPEIKDLAQQIADAVAKETGGLRDKRDSLLGEKHKLQEKIEEYGKSFEALGGTDGIKRLVEMRERLNKDELGKLLADGLYDEWFDKRTASMRLDHGNQVTALEEKLALATEAQSSADTRFSRKVLETDVRAAAVKAKVLDTAHIDVLLAAQTAFTYDPKRGMHVIKDEDGGVLPGKDGKTPKNIQEWIEEQHEDRRHWWPTSTTAGALGGIGGGAGEPDVVPDNMSMDDYRKYRVQRGMPTVAGGHPLD